MLRESTSCRPCRPAWPRRRSTRGVAGLPRKKCFFGSAGRLQIARFASARKNARDERHEEALYATLALDSRSCRKKTCFGSAGRSEGALCFCAKKRLREVTGLPGKIFSAARAIYTSSALPSREKALAPHDATALTEKTFLDSAVRLRYTLPLREKTLAPHDEHDIFRKGQARLEGPALPKKPFSAARAKKRSCRARSTTYSTVHLAPSVLHSRHLSRQ